MGLASSVAFLATRGHTVNEIPYLHHSGLPIVVTNLSMFSYEHQFGIVYSHFHLPLYNWIFSLHGAVHLYVYAFATVKSYNYFS